MYVGYIYFKYHEDGSDDYLEKLHNKKVLLLRATNSIQQIKLKHGKMFRSHYIKFVVSL